MLVAPGAPEGAAPRGRSRRSGGGAGIPRGLRVRRPESDGVDQLFLIDGSSYFYRAFYGMRGLTTSKGFPTNAIYVFTSMMVKILKQRKPRFLGIVFDAPGPTFREKTFADYKAHRPPMPEDLAKQIPYIKRIPELFSVSAVEVGGVEADDVIGTLARRATARGIDTVIVTGDKDLMQLVTKELDDSRPGIVIYDDMKERMYGIKEVVDRFGVPPARVADVLALMGDVTDNIPGVRGIGEKTASKLIAQYGGVEEIYRGLDRVEPRWRKILEPERRNAEISKDLATIRIDVPVPLEPEAMTPGEPDLQRLIPFLTDLEFSKLLDAFQGADRVRQRALTTEQYGTILKEEDLQAVWDSLAREETIALDVETSGPDPMRAELVGVSLCAAPGKGFYIPLGHRYLGAPAQLDRSVVLRGLQKLVGDPRKRIVGQNIGFDALVLERCGVTIANIAFDTMLAAYLVNPDRGPFNLESLSREYLGHEKISFEDVAGRGKGQLTFDQIDVERVSRKACEDVDVTLRLVPILEERLRRDGLLKLLQEMEVPLVRVLLDMERIGVRIDAEFLRRLSSEMAARSREIQKEIFAIAGEEFNVDSPKQLQRILFEKLKLSPGKRTKTGLSTDESVLARLAPEHPLPAKILQHRQLNKLRGTYVDALPQLIHPDTGRVHTSYNQAVAATGRLSSSDPNLQNIPIRTEEGRKIRRAFVPEPDHLLISADYSQLELRILAHMSEDPGLVGAFREDRDVHRATAAEVFGLPPEQVPDELRSRAKAINFGIIYGMSAFGLAQRLRIDQKTAQEYINLYFGRYRRVKEFLDRVLEQGEKLGYVTTLFGRRRYVPQLASKNWQIRGQEERVAINAPIQGTAADIMKIAMINVWNRYRNEGFSAKMILQVHDELVIEAPEREADRAAEVVRAEMERALEMRVPLKVDVSRGRNWADLE